MAHSSSLIGTALQLLTSTPDNQATLKTSLGTLTRVLNAVTWTNISKGKPEAWLYFYEEFLEVYDNALRKETGSYYTPPEVVGAMVNLVDAVLRTRFGQHSGLASPSVTVADPATGTGTYILGILRKIAETIKIDEGEGAVREAISEAIKRIIAFEIQLGPFAVAQLRILAEILDLTGIEPTIPARMFVTNTLGNPDDDEGWIPGLLKPIAMSRKDANRIKREEPITVIIGNPPYKVKAKGLGGWIEGENKEARKTAPLADWMPLPEWKMGTHTKHLYNLYVYFWRWATWKAYDMGPGSKTGVVCFITMAGFLGGLGFQRMREYLRRTCDDIWVIDCSPEGHQPDVSSRIFQGVQQPICIVLGSRSPQSDLTIPATVRFATLPEGHRTHKFEALEKISLHDECWVSCPTDWRSPFLPSSGGDWATYPSLDSLFIYNGSGVMPGRTWVVAPDVTSLTDRWDRLISAKTEEQEALFHPHLCKGKLGDKHMNKPCKTKLGSFELRGKPVSADNAGCVTPTRYGFRSFDRQWIIPDSRLINRPNPDLWGFHSNNQVYLTAFTEESPSSGPAVTFTGLIPDLHHYKGSFGGRVFPLWCSVDKSKSNIKPKLLEFLAEKYGREVTAEDIMCYIAAIAAHPAFTSRFQSDLSTPGLRIPVTASGNTFFEAAEIGRNVIWLHTYGERMTDEKQGRPPQPPRLPVERRPRIPKDGPIPNDPLGMPDSIAYDKANSRLAVGGGYIDNVEEAVWDYEISGKRVVSHWFSYRKANREKPIIGDRRPPSALGIIQPDHWLAEYTSELINLLNVLGMLVGMQPLQAGLLTRVCSEATITANELAACGALDASSVMPIVKTPQHPSLFAL